MIGEDTYEYEAGQMALYSIDVPMAGRVTRATVSEPYLLLLIDLDAEKIADLTLKVFPNGLPQPRDPHSLYVGEPDPYLIDAATNSVRVPGVDLEEIQNYFRRYDLLDDYDEVKP